MELSVINRQGCVVQVRGEVDGPQCPALREELQRCVNDGHDRIGVDFSGVTFRDSAGVSLLVSAMKSVPSNVTVQMVGASRQVRRLFGVLGFARVLPPEETPIDAGRVLRQRLFDPVISTSITA